MDRNGTETLVVIVKETWRITHGGTLAIADEQVQIRLTPQYRGEPGSSSLWHDSDLVLEKPGTDCVLLGHAWAPEPKAPHVDVIFAVGPVRKDARVFGERIWMKVMGMVSMSRSAPFEKIPLTWERAFGGADASCYDPAAHELVAENPVGRGFVARHSKLKVDGLLLPNIENPSELIKKPQHRPRPVGFGMIPPHWQPRSAYAGTYDDAWRKSVSPLPPADLDPRFYSAAAPGLLTPGHLTGGEQGCLLFSLPGITPRAKLRRKQGEEELRLRLDTVIVEPDEARVVLVWRGTLNMHGLVQQLGALSIE